MAKPDNCASHALAKHTNLSHNHTPSPLDLITADMRAVDAVIAQRLDSRVPLIKDVAQYIISAGGKRLRPALLLLCSGAIESNHADRHTLAAVVEFIHTATLLHDDVVDESTLRRGRATANETFGNAASVLVGDFLYSRAFQMMVATDNMRVMEILSDATNVIAEGEVMQLINMRDASLDETGYLDVIRSKTAKLFEASARLAAVLPSAPQPWESACATYGQAIGTAFQVIDDVLDYEGDASHMGKNLGDDLREGKVTLPVIAALKEADPGERSIIQEAIEEGQFERLPDIVDIVKRRGGLEAARQAAMNEAQRAAASLEALPDNRYRQALLQLTADLLQRQH